MTVDRKQRIVGDDKWNRRLAMDGILLEVEFVRITESWKLPQAILSG